MPVFEYKCKKCGTVSDILVGVTAEQPEVACVECGCSDVVKLFSPFEVGEAHSRFPIASSCACGHESSAGCGHEAGAGACACGMGGCGSQEA